MRLFVSDDATAALLSPGEVVLFAAPPNGKGKDDDDDDILRRSAEDCVLFVEDSVLFVLLTVEDDDADVGCVSVLAVTALSPVLFIVLDTQCFEVAGLGEGVVSRCPVLFACEDEASMVGFMSLLVMGTGGVMPGWLSVFVVARDGGWLCLAPPISELFCTLDSDCDRLSVHEEVDVGRRLGDGSGSPCTRVPEIVGSICVVPDPDLLLLEETALVRATCAVCMSVLASCVLMLAVGAVDTSKHACCASTFS